MSQIYATEPQTSGRVIIETTHGPLEIQLWCRECPSTTKYFLQLCLDGYYDEMVFHRVVPNFLIQTGALRKGSPPPVASELEDYRRKHGAEEALERRRFELNSRIRFNHRGQVAMALDIDENHNGAIMQPQFFVTLDEAANLDGKHVCFGTVTGPTFFNAMRIGRTDVDETTMQPTMLDEAPRIESIKIVENPIHTEIVPTLIVAWKNTTGKGPKQKKKRKRKGIKNTNVLSFGDEMEDSDLVSNRIQSSHDVAPDKSFSKHSDKRIIDIVSATKLPSKSKPSRQDDSEKASTSTTGLNIQPQFEPTGKETVQPVFISKAEKARTNELKAEIQQVKVPERVKEKPKKVSLVEARRLKYAKRGAVSKKERQSDTLSKLKMFQSKVVCKRPEKSSSTKKNESSDGVHIARLMHQTENKEQGTPSNRVDETEEGIAYYGQVLENDDEAKTDWMKTKFKCRQHMDHDASLGGDGRSALHDYEVIDNKDGGGRSQTRKRRHDGRKKR